MPSSPFDSALYRDLFGDPEIGRLLSDSAEVRAMLLVEGALAKAQAEHGLIPADASEAIHRASLEAAIDPAALAPATGENAVPVPALVAAFRKEIGDPAAAGFVHWGATSQDITDTALVLRLRQCLAIFEARLVATVRELGTLAEARADLPMAGRTYGQNAVPTSFGALVAAWGAPLLGHHARLTIVRQDLLHVSLSGAAGTLSAMGDKGPAVRASLARQLGLADPEASWHATRDTIAELSAWLTAVTAALGKMGEDLVLLTQTGIGEVRLGGSGASSTMPQKQNPVAPSVLGALARHATGLNATLQQAAVHRLQRDGAAWLSEWLALPQLCLTAGRALLTARDLAPRIAPDPDAMARNILVDGGAIFAEALSFALAERMPRPEAQAEVKRLVAEARSAGRPLALLAADAYSDLDPATFDAAAQLGTAPDEARAFAAAAQALAAPA